MKHMKHYTYLIIGGGITADAAAHAIRRTDATGTIGIFSNENDPPYDRPPLSKKLWKGDPLSSIWRTTSDVKVDIHLGCTVTAIDPAAKSVTDHTENVTTYDKLLIATGGQPNKFPGNARGVIYFRTVDDFRRLHELARHKDRFLVIGGGFIGSEIAAALAMNGKNVTMVFPDPGIGARVYPARVVAYLNTYFEKHNVTVYANDGVQSIVNVGDEYDVITKSGKTLRVDAVVAGIGITPNVALAEAAGLKVDNGIHVDEHCRTSNPDIFAAGDVANYYNATLAVRRRVEHEDNANVMGAAAGSAMAGAPVDYDYLPYFYSDLFDIGYEAVGELDARMEMVEDWKTEFQEGVIYYLKNNRVRGVLLWNVWEQVDAARALIAEPGPFTAANVKGRLPAPPAQ